MTQLNLFGRDGEEPLTASSYDILNHINGNNKLGAAGSVDYMAA